ncbi:TIGR04282 family arsenosugar biosynthesis glycosyltransferase [Echinicola shivajiensis]|uniref:TIGR04282 family arsenosugar biosynthesis glycosyltransferase n=1 Tax=Echinicola shivajiensis TaxID=1035916 RepID=UPI001BFC0CCF|nr:TIGR04282 family arsenosugar biosynthesis glycosyltransferase [Echinicola shivajiensis]
MNEHAIIIFQKNPQPGKVKTRLGEVIGGEKAAEVYEYLLNYTHDLVKNYPADVFVYFQEEVDKSFLLNEHYHLSLQGNGGLSDKMKQAFAEVLGKGYQKVLIIGSDCMELNTDILDEAFEALNYQDLVVGPAQDGSFYLLGMGTLYDELFEEKSWKDLSDVEDIYADAKQLKLNLHKLKTLSDVEVYEDLKSLKGLLNIH